MDPLSHSLAGLVLGQTGLKRLTPSAAWIAVIASNAPDFDSIFEPFGDLRHLEWHRHFTHTLFFAPLIGVAAVAIVKYILRRPVEWKGASIFATVCCLAHVCCDLLTFRGVRVFLPFSDWKTGLRTQGLIDPVFISILFLALAIPFLSNLVSGEIGAKKSRGNVVAILMLLVAGGWFYSRYLLRETALNELRGRVYEGQTPRRVDVFPLSHPLKFVGYLETDTAFKEIDVDLSEYFDPEAGQTFFKPVLSVESGRAAEKAGTDDKVQVFLTWARWPRWQVNRYDGDVRWTVVVEELAFERHRTRPRVIVSLNERYEILESKYEAARYQDTF
jgi:membrane-bound metal-dependent hydrolase YbcI (DUF457 family)